MASVNPSPDHGSGSLALPQRRARQGVSLQQIADSTKISTRFLRSIESEDFSELPGGIFAVSYIRQYADAIDFDAESLLERYREVTGTPEPVRQNGTRRPPVTETGRKTALQWFRAIAAQKL